MELLGEIFWWICRAKPFQRGDPSIAEMLVKAVALACDKIELPPWKEGLIPWAEVMVEPDPHAFGKNFNTLFESKKGKRS